MAGHHVLAPVVEPTYTAISEKIFVAVLVNAGEGGEVVDVVAHALTFDVILVGVTKVLLVHETIVEPFGRELRSRHAHKVHEELLDVAVLVGNIILEIEDILAISAFVLTGRAAIVAEVR